MLSSKDVRGIKFQLILSVVIPETAVNNLNTVTGHIPRTCQRLIYGLIILTTYDTSTLSTHATRHGSYMAEQLSVNSIVGYQRNNVGDIKVGKHVEILNPTCRTDTCRATLHSGVIKVLNLSTGLIVSIDIYQLRLYRQLFLEVSVYSGYTENSVTLIGNDIGTLNIVQIRYRQTCVVSFSSIHIVVLIGHNLLHKCLDILQDSLIQLDFQVLNTIVLAGTNLGLEVHHASNAVLINVKFGIRLISRVGNSEDIADVVVVLISAVILVINSQLFGTAKRTTGHLNLMSSILPPVSRHKTQFRYYLYLIFSPQHCLLEIQGNDFCSVYLNGKCISLVLYPKEQLRVKIHISLISPRLTILFDGHLGTSYAIKQTREIVTILLRRNSRVEFLETLNIMHGSHNSTIIQNPAALFDKRRYQLIQHLVILIRDGNLTRVSKILLLFKSKAGFGSLIRTNTCDDIRTAQCHTLFSLRNRVPCLFTGFQQITAFQHFLSRGRLSKKLNSCRLSTCRFTNECDNLGTVTIALSAHSTRIGHGICTRNGNQFAIKIYA